MTKRKRKPTVSKLKKNSMKSSIKNVICSYCAAGFHLPPSRVIKKNHPTVKTQKRYCSVKCFNLSLKTNTERKCDVCGKGYYVSKSQVKYRNIKRCSLQCKYKKQKMVWKMNHKKNKKEEREAGNAPRHFYTRRLKKGKTRTTRSFIKKLDKVFSLFIRKRDANSSGNAACISCGNVYHYTQMDAGHYVSRNRMALRFDERNVHAQCRKCNRFMNGAMDEYALALQRKYGPDILVKLNAEKNKIKQFTIQELQT